MKLPSTKLFPFIILILVSYLCGKFKLYSGLFLVLIVIYSWISLQPKYNFDHASITSELKRFQVKRKTETVDWVNKLLLQLWVQWFIPEITEWIRNELEGILNTESNKFKKIQITSLTFGKRAPMITSLHEMDRNHNPYQLPLEVDLIYFGEFSITIKGRFKGKMTSTTFQTCASSLILMGNVRVLISFLKKPTEDSPCISNIAFSFQKIPTVSSLTVKALGGIQLNNLPLVRSWLLHTVENGLKFITLPSQIVWEWRKDRWILWNRFKVPIDLVNYQTEKERLEEFELKKKDSKLEKGLKRELEQAMTSKEKNDQSDYEKERGKEKDKTSQNGNINKKSQKYPFFFLSISKDEKIVVSKSKPKPNQEREIISRSLKSKNENSVQYKNRNISLKKKIDLINNRCHRSKAKTSNKDKHKNKNSLSRAISILRGKTVEQNIKLNNRIDQMNEIILQLNNLDSTTTEYNQSYRHKLSKFKLFKKDYDSIIIIGKEILENYKKTIQKQSRIKKNVQLKKWYRSEYYGLIENFKLLENSGIFLTKQLQTIISLKKKEVKRRQKSIGNSLF
ncbi:c2 domain-containing protein-like [Anaeramoeba flamelloides]|uniref:C2 domain-containing protein-like n=1 Tax=Anaeramoeba flamelloides TaxID=1746091 RepID=A0ABQ8XGB8_9EUKA|nr:c2 domain-containing protein-like [Anaeramoeba flamelloides]